MFGKRNILSLVAAISVLVLALGCQQAAAPQPTPKPAEGRAAATPTKAAEKAAERPVRGGTLRASAGEIDSLDPIAAVTSSPGNVSYDSLFDRGMDYTVNKEGLVTDWTVSADGKAVTLKLQQGVKFHDGTDFDAAAVKFHIERIKDPASKSPFRSDYAKVTSIEVVDGLTARFSLSAPDPLLLPVMAGKGAQVVSPAAVKKYGQDFARNPVGSGPFQFVEWVPGDRVTFKRFEGYWKKDKDGNRLPYLDQVVFKLIPDQVVAFASLRTGQVDLQTGLPPAQLSLLKNEPKLTYSSVPQSFGQGLYLNTKRSPFDNKALRQAVALAVDREGIASMLGETATADASVFGPLSWGSDPKVGDFPARDLAKAKAKMTEAGYSSGGLKVKNTTTNSDNAIREAEILKANLAEIGVEMEIESLTGPAHTTKVRQEQSYQMSNHSTGAVDTDPGHFAGIALHSKGSRNYYGPYGNPKVDELIEKAGNIYDRKERTPLYREVAKLVADDLPFVRLHATNALVGMDKKVRNYKPSPFAETMVAVKLIWLAQ